MTKTKEEILKDYERKGEVIMRKMLQVVMRANKKAENSKYTDIIKKIDKEIA
jgi:hypothetical protein